MTAGTTLVVSLITLAFSAFATGLAFVEFWSRDYRQPLQTASEKATRDAVKAARDAVKAAAKKTVVDFMAADEGELNPWPDLATRAAWRFRQSHPDWARIQGPVCRARSASHQLAR